MDNHFGENCVVHQVVYGMETRYLGIGTLMTQAVPYLGTDLGIRERQSDSTKLGTGNKSDEYKI